MKTIDRMDRVNANLLRLLSGIVHHELDANNDLVTLTSVLTNRDLQEALISVTAIDNVEKYVEILNQNQFSIRSRLKPLLDFKVIPNLKFVVDKHGQDITQVEKILDSLP